MKVGQSGFGIIQVMVVISATAAFTYVLLRQSETTNKQQAKITYEQVLQAQVHEIQTELIKLENCTTSLGGMRFSPSPTTVNSLNKGTIDTTNPENFITGPAIFSIMKPNSVGVYIQDMNILTRTEADPNFPNDPTKTINRDVLRVNFVRGDIDSAGNIRDRSKTIGGAVKGFDFFIQSNKDASGSIITCYGDNSNAVANTCKAMNDTVWNETTKKCEFPEAIHTGDLVPIWIQPGGELGLSRPSSASLTQPAGYLVKP